MISPFFPPTNVHLQMKYDTLKYLYSFLSVVLNNLHELLTKSLELAI